MTQPMRSGSAHPRIPGAAANPLHGADAPIQVNHCRMPECEHFGIPARERRGKPGPSADRDLRYKITGTHKGRVPSLRCNACGENPPLKSNLGVAEEIARIARPLCLAGDEGCPREGCENAGKGVSDRPELYRPMGRNHSGRTKRRCRACGRQFLIGPESPRIHPPYRHLASEVFSRVVNKSPMRRAMRGAGIEDKP